MTLNKLLEDLHVLSTMVDGEKEVRILTKYGIEKILKIQLVNNISDDTQKAYIETENDLSCEN